MSPWIVLLIVLLIIVIGLAVLYFLGKKAQKKQEAQQEQIEAAKQTIPMLIIDKKRLPIKESGLPQMVIDQTPKLMRRSKLPIVKAKVGPRIMTLVIEPSSFTLLGWFRPAPIDQYSSLLPPVGVWTVSQFQCGGPSSQNPYPS